MRIFLFIILLFANLVADSKTTPLFVGAGAYVQTQPYKGTDPLITPSPVVFFDNHLFYVRWTRVGMYVAGSSNDDFSWGLSITAQPRPFGYKASDSSFLTGMDNRDNTIEAGAALDMEYKNTFFSVMFFNDVLNKYNSYMAKIELGHHFDLGKLDLYPSISTIYHAAKFNEYYYGVKQSEATLSKPVYSPSSSFDYSIQTYIKYALTDQWSALFNIRADYLSKEEQNSPIVNDKYMFSGLASVMYKFEI